MSGGYRTYLSRLVPLLAAHPQIEALLVGMPETMDVAEWREGASSVQWLSLRCGLAARGREAGREARTAIDRFAPDVIFIPTSRHFALDGIPVVSMVRNMIPLTPREATSGMERVRNWARLHQMKQAVQRSTRVIAVSQFVRDSLVTEVGIPKDRVGVVYHGIDSSSMLPLRKPSLFQGNSPACFVFTAGEMYRYRALEDLIHAWTRLRDLGSLPTLVMAGKEGQGMSRYCAGLRRLVSGLGLDSHIRFAGALTRSEMAWCYRHCSMFIMTSRVEACPNTALEAIAHGCIVVAADNPPLPEMFETAAFYYPPGDYQALAVMTQKILQMPDSQKAECQERALHRARQFSWPRCVDRTVKELTLATERPS